MDTHLVLLGPESATFSHRAYGVLASIFDAPPLAETRVITADRNGEVLETLLRVPNAWGVIATTTQVRGRVNESLEAFVRLGAQVNGKSPVKIVGAAKIPLDFALMARCNENEIEGVIAHAEALGACETSIKMMKGWPTEEASSNGRAAELVATVGRYARFAALGPIEAAAKFGLNVLNPVFEKGITTFFLLTSEDTRARIGDENRALMVFRTKQGPGALVDALMPFKMLNINLNHIHSVYNAMDKVYNFVMEAECTRDQMPHMAMALESHRMFCEQCTMFGPFELRTV